MTKIDYKLIPNKPCDGALARFSREKLSRPINEKLLAKYHDENLIKVIFVKTSRNMGDEENEFKVNRHAVREYLEVLRPKAIQSCQSFHI